jgi:hypothetical protein
MALMQRWKGRIFAEALSLKRGGLSDANTGLSGLYMQGAAIIPIQAVAALTQDYSGAVPPGSTIFGMDFICVTAFTGATVTLAVGNAAGNAAYVAAVDIKTPAATKTSLTLIGTAALISMPVLASGKNVWARVTQTATTTAVGTGYLVIQYV